MILFRNLIYLSAVYILLLAGCGKSSDQKEFEEQAYSDPSGITQTSPDANEQPIQIDPDDWRISPMYQGLVQFETLPHPNPVVRNSQIGFDLNINYTESLPGLFIYIYDPFDDRLQQEILANPDPVPIGLENIMLDTSGFPQNSPDNLYRIIIFDGRQNIISYGDIEIQ